MNPGCRKLCGAKEASKPLLTPLIVLGPLCKSQTGTAATSPGIPKTAQDPNFIFPEPHGHFVDKLGAEVTFL